MKYLKWKIVGVKMNKTLVVEVDRKKSHLKYKKTFKVTKKYYVHDENNEGKLGEMVVFVETRPISKLKRWKVKD